MTKVIENTSSAVKALKAVGQKTLRLFPGYNRIDDSVNLSAYFDGNKAAQGMLKECLREVDKDTLSHEDLQRASIAQDKNNELNKAQKIIKAQKETIADGDSTIVEQGEKLATLEEKLKEALSKIEDLTEAMEDDDETNETNDDDDEPNDE